MIRRKQNPKFKGPSLWKRLSWIELLIIVFGPLFIGYIILEILGVFK